MDSLVNTERPLVFCPGCSHELIVRALDNAFTNIGFTGEQVAIVSDIGCSGLVDTFFNTHALHGLHGRALTYATGLKMARPELNIVVTMGDGGLGIGGAHLLSTCRRNIDLTLLVFNNFNYGMTGGQYSPTTPSDAAAGSGFLNQLEKPFDVCQVAGSAGAAYVARISAYDKELAKQIQKAIEFKGFSLMDIWGICTGRYAKQNSINPKSIDKKLEGQPPVNHFFEANARPEFTKKYYEHTAALKEVPPPKVIEKECEPLQTGRQEIIILGKAGQRIVTAGELLCLAGIYSGMHATQKNDYPITVMRGHSVSELIISDEKIGYTGISNPYIVIALAAEGVNRRKSLFDHLSEQSQVFRAKGIGLPSCKANIQEIDFKMSGLKSQDWALASLTVLASQEKIINIDMLKKALASRFPKKTMDTVLPLVDSVHAKANSIIYDLNP